MAPIIVSRPNISIKTFQGPAIGGLCPSGYTLVTNNGQQECADAANAAACTAASSGTGNTGSACKDVQTK